MKIRNGFVSNSSSSSFVLARKSDVSYETIAEALTKNFYKISEDSPAYKTFNELMKLLVQEMNGDTLDKNMRDSWGGTRESMTLGTPVLDRFTDKEIYVGSINGYGEGGNMFEDFLCDHTCIEYDGGNFYVKKEDSY